MQPTPDENRSLGPTTGDAYTVHAGEEPPEVPRDGELTAEAILAHAGFVRALARSLLRDPADVDDLVQETLARALERGPRRREALLAWLRTVVRNLAFKGYRGRARRERRERDAARPEGLPGVDDLFAREAALRDLTAAVLDLPEQAREVVMLRYYEGLSPQAIAERLGIESGTVRMRLHRALVALRRRLDAESGGDRLTWMRGVALLAGVRPEELAEGASGGALEAAGGLSPGALFGVLIGAALLTGLGAWALFGRGAAPKDASALVGAAALEVSDTELELTAQGTVPEGPGERTTVAFAGDARSAGEPEAPPAPEPRAVRGRVLAADGTPVGGATVLGAWEGSELVPRGESLADGTFALPLAERDLAGNTPGADQPILLAAHAQGHAPSGVLAVPHARGVTQGAIELTLRGPGAGLAVRVADQQGEPVVGARIAVGERLRLGLGLVGPLQADEENPIAPLLAARATGARRMSFPGRPDLRGSLGALLAPRSGELTRLTPARKAASDDQGWARFTGLEPGATRLHVSAPGHVSVLQEVMLAPALGAGAGPKVHTVTLTRAARIEGRVERSDGAPIRSVIVHAVARDGSATRTLRADRDGAFQVDGLTPGEVRVVAEELGPGGARAERTVQLAAGATLPLTLSSSETARRDVLVTCDGAPCVALELEVRAVHNPMALLERAETDAEGRASLARTYAMAAELWVLVPERGPRAPLPLHIVALPDGAPEGGPEGGREAGPETAPSAERTDAALVIALRSADFCRATVTGRLSTADGAPLPEGTWVQATRLTASRVVFGRPGQVGADGRFELGPLPVGRYRLTAPYLGLGQSFPDTLTVAAEGRLEVGDLRLAAPAALDVAVLGGGWTDLWLAESEGEPPGFVLFDGRVEDGATLWLGPGTYTVRSGSLGSKTLSLPAGGRVALTLRP